MTNKNQLFPTKQKALNLAKWLTFSERMRKSKYRVQGNDDAGYFVVPISSNSKSNVPLHCLDMDFANIEDIGRDTDILDPWVSIKGMFSVMDGEILRFILKYSVPLNKFIRVELAQRGFDEDHLWVGFDKAREIWLR
jgi:hypothetical protein